MEEEDIDFDDLNACYITCLGTVRYCLSEGGEHAERNHIALLLDCADICQVTSAFMFPTSNIGMRVAEICAEVCQKCAESCEKFKDDEQMDACAQICRKCEATCRAIAGTTPAPS